MDRPAVYYDRKSIALGRHGTEDVTLNESARFHRGRISGIGLNGRETLAQMPRNVCEAGPRLSAILQKEATLIPLL